MNNNDCKGWAVKLLVDMLRYGEVAKVDKIKHGISALEQNQFQFFYTVHAFSNIYFIYVVWYWFHFFTDMCY